MQVLQVFHRYLDHSSNWAYRLICGLKNVGLTIVSPVFLNSQYLITSAKYIRPLIRLSSPGEESFWINFIHHLNNRYIKTRIRLNKNQFEIIHAHFAHTACEYVSLIKSLNKKLVVSFYGYDYENLPYKQPRYIELYKELFIHASAFVVEGKHGASLLEKMGCSPTKIYVVPLGIDVSSIPQRLKYKKQDELNLVQVSNYKEKKGHIYTIESFRLALINCPNLTLTLVGVGDGREVIEELVNLYHIEDKVYFINSVNPKELYNFLLDYDVLIQPSMTTEDKDTEGGAPVIILDAQACGLPVISTFHADIPNVVLQNKTALLSNEKDVDSLANSIQSFYQMDEKTYTAYSNHAKEYVVEHFDINKCSETLEKVYNSLLN
ncbi:MAG: glycosyltransferase family 4 protein [Bacteroidetes bacterium]|nr:glycosyltransferase family 4 protein [Bacteroidota bacterium]